MFSKVLSLALVTAYASAISLEQAVTTLAQVKVKDDDVKPFPGCTINGFCQQEEQYKQEQDFKESENDLYMTYMEAFNTP